jgi:signal transduction histidine kinase
VIVAYVVAGKLGINLAVASGVITPVWAPAGIALFAVLVLGYRVWPAIALAAFLTNFTEGEPALPSAGIAAGNTLEALAGAWLFQRVLGGDAALRRARDVVALIVGAGLVSTMASATIGTATLWAAGDLANGYGSSWLLWWLGDAMGDVVVTPLLLVWARRDRLPPPARLLEGVALVAVVTAVAAVVFLGGRWQYPYVLFPLFLWAAFRFGQRGATTVVFLVSAIAVAGIVDGAVAISGIDARQTVQLIQVLLGMTGAATMVLAAALDERSSAERAVRDSLALYEAVLGATADGIVVLDSSGRPITHNRQFVDMWGPQASGTEIAQLVADVGAGPDDSGDSGELSLNGRVFERYSQPYRVERGGGRVWSFRDVTARRRAEAAREEFLTMASHELRTPLTVILGFTGALLDEWPRLDDEGRRGLVGRVLAQSERLAALVDGLLATAAIESGNLAVARVPTVVADVVQRAVDDLGGEGVEVDVPAGLTALADPHHMRQILVNFIGNAVKYGRAPLAVTASAEGEWCEVRVTDAGDGVPADVRDRLFGRFVRAQRASDARIPGSGLGLAITRDLARLQGGDVWYEDAVPRGACFGLRLPLASTDVADPAWSL